MHLNMDIYEITRLKRLISNVPKQDEGEGDQITYYHAMVGGVPVFNSTPRTRLSSSATPRLKNGTFRKGKSATVTPRTISAINIHVAENDHRESNESSDKSEDNLKVVPIKSQASETRMTILPMDSEVQESLKIIESKRLMNELPQNSDKSNKSLQLINPSHLKEDNDEDAYLDRDYMPHQPQNSYSNLNIPGNKSIAITDAYEEPNIYSEGPVSGDLRVRQNSSALNLPVPRKSRYDQSNQYYDNDINRNISDQVYETNDQINQLDQTVCNYISNEKNPRNHFSVENDIKIQSNMSYENVLVKKNHNYDQNSYFSNILRHISIYKKNQRVAVSDDKGPPVKPDNTRENSVSRFLSFSSRKKVVQDSVGDGDPSIDQQESHAVNTRTADGQPGMKSDKIKRLDTFIYYPTIDNAPINYIAPNDDSNFNPNLSLNLVPDFSPDFRSNLSPKYSFDFGSNVSPNFQINIERYETVGNTARHPSPLLTPSTQALTNLSTSLENSHAMSLSNRLANKFNNLNHNSSNNSLPTLLSSASTATAMNNEVTPTGLHTDIERGNDTLRVAKVDDATTSNYRKRNTREQKRIFFPDSFDDGNQKE